MSSICDADTAFVFENSTAASLSSWYCASVPSTVLRTPVRAVSMSMAAEPQAAAARPMGTVIPLVAFSPTCSIL